MRSRLSAAFLVGAAFGIAGCSGDGPSSTTGPNAAPTKKAAQSLLRMVTSSFLSFGCMK